VLFARAAAFIQVLRETMKPPESRKISLVQNVLVDRSRGYFLTPIMETCTARSQ